MKIVEDHPATCEFVIPTGRLIQNFGVVEMASFHWLEFFSGGEVAVKIEKEVPLARRIDAIMRRAAAGRPTAEAGGRK